MAAKDYFKIDKNLDLKLERVVDVAPKLVWAAWTTPKHIKHWFTPAPWKTVDCKIDLRPGGMFYTVMESPEGERFPGNGCWLEVVENERLTWTDALLPGYRPNGEGFMTATVIIEKHAKGTKYTAIARHKDESDRKKHEDMGFFDGWGTALDQLVAYMKKVGG